MFYMRVHFTEDYDALEKLEKKYEKSKETGEVLVVGSNGWEIVCDEDILEEIKAYCKKSRKKLFVEGVERLAPYVIVDPHEEEGPPIVTHTDCLDLVEEEKLLCGLEINPSETELWEAWEASVASGYGEFPSDEVVLDLLDCHDEDCEDAVDCDCIADLWENMREKFSFKEAYKKVKDYCFEAFWDQDF